MMVPQTFEQWKRCIEHDCKIQLTRDFAQQRLTIYEDKAHPQTRNFILLYGKQHLQNIITWLKQIKQSIENIQ